MNRFLFLVLLLTGGLLMTACRTLPAGRNAAPEAVSEQFFVALRNQEYEKAKELGTEETARIVGVIQTLSEMGGGVNIIRDNKKELISCVIENDLAICSYKAFSGPDEKVYLVKMKGRWLVDLRRGEKTDTPVQ